MDIGHHTLKLTTFCIDKGVIIASHFEMSKCDYFPVDLRAKAPNFKLTLDTTQKNLIFVHLIVSSFPPPLNIQKIIPNLQIFYVKLKEETSLITLM